MKLIVIKKKKLRYVLVGLLTFLSLFLTFQLYNIRSHTSNLIMGGILYPPCNHIDAIEANQIIPKETNKEKYFRPSKSPIINDRDFYGKEHLKIPLEDSLFKTPEDTIINYFSILREAANPQDGKFAGCGTLGSASDPYPVAYNFLTSTYQDRLEYNQYLNSFDNILHINLIKLQKVPVFHPNSTRYFFELETIEGSEKGIGHFAYYYGFLYIEKEKGQYRISDQEFYGENYLCAPYHGWNYIAEAVVDIKYGDWCSLLLERYPTQQEGYIKNIYFKGTDGHDYLVEFIQLTNDNDLEIAQFKKNEKGDWELVVIDTNKCLENK